MANEMAMPGGLLPKIRWVCIGAWWIPLLGALDRGLVHDWIGLGISTAIFFASLGGIIWLPSEPVAAQGHDLRNAPNKGSTGLLIGGKDNTFHNVRVEGFDTAIRMAPEAERNQFSQIQASKDAAQDAQKAPVIGYGDDRVSIQDAVKFVLMGHWPAPGEDWPYGKVGQPALDALTAMRTAACHQQMTIFGIEYNGQLPGPIPSEYWRNHQVEYLTAVLAESTATIKTESATSMPAEKKYKNLLVLKSQVEALWPPH